MADATVKYQTEVKVQHRIKSDTIKYCENDDRKEELQVKNKRNELIRDYQSLKKDNLNIWKHWKIKQARLMNMKRKC